MGRGEQGEQGVTSRLGDNDTVCMLRLMECLGVSLLSTATTLTSELTTLLGLLYLNQHFFILSCFRSEFLTKTELPVLLSSQLCLIHFLNVILMSNKTNN